MASASCARENDSEGEQLAIDSHRLYSPLCFTPKRFARHAAGWCRGHAGRLAPRCKTNSTWKFTTPESGPVRPLIWGVNWAPDATGNCLRGGTKTVKRQDWPVTISRRFLRFYFTNLFCHCFVWYVLDFSCHFFVTSTSTYFYHYHCEPFPVLQVLIFIIPAQYSCHWYWSLLLGCFWHWMILVFCHYF